MLHFAKIAIKLNHWRLTATCVGIFCIGRLIGKFVKELGKAKHLIVTLKLRRNALLKNMFAIMGYVSLKQCAILVTHATKRFVHRVI